MATRFVRSRSFKDDPQLRSFHLSDVTATGKTLGVGSYGSVVEVCEAYLYSITVLNKFYQV